MKTPVTGAVALTVASIALSACATAGSGSGASASVERAAAAADAASASPAPAGGSGAASSAAPSPSSGSPSEDAANSGVLGARVCIINARSEGQRPEARLYVHFTKADRVSEPPQPALGDVLSPGLQRCGEAAYTTADYDVTGDISVMYIDAEEVYFQASNAFAGPPSVYVRQRKSDAICAAAVTVGTNGVYDNGVVRYTTERLADSANFKEFTITVSDSVRPFDQCGKAPIVE